MRLRRNMVDYLLHSHDPLDYNDVIIIQIIPIVWWRGVGSGVGRGAGRWVGRGVGRGKGYERGEG